jgi:hypothetical protein
LLKGALRLGHDELARALEEYAKVLAAALEGNGSTMISGQARQDLLGAYEDLRAAAPDAFDLSAERDRREPVIIDSLLEQTPGLTRQAIYRVYAAGVNRLRAFYQATPEELAATTGVDKEVCEKILARFDAYRRRRAEGSPGEGPETALDRLASVVRDLQRTDEQFRGIDEYGDRRRRRELRGQRQALVHEVDITLAQLGEVELLEQLKRFPVDRKIQRIQRYLRQPRMT